MEDVRTGGEASSVENESGGGAFVSGESYRKDS